MHGQIASTEGRDFQLQGVGSVDILPGGKLPCLRWASAASDSQVGQRGLAVGPAQDPLMMVLICSGTPYQFGCRAFLRMHGRSLSSVQLQILLPNKYLAPQTLSLHVLESMIVLKNRLHLHVLENADLFSRIEMK